VKIACLAQLVNVIAPISTANGGGSWRQTIYYPFLHASRYGRGVALDARVSAPCYESSRFGEVPFVQAVAVLDEEREELTVFAVNRSKDERMELELGLSDFELWRGLERIELAGFAPKARNSLAQPNAVAPRSLPFGAKVESGRLSASLAPLSWNVLRFGKAKGLSSD
jgi:Alpha-L-arabinofuranosidase